MNRELAPPSGWPAPRAARLGDHDIPLVGRSEAVAERYFERFPEDRERYGDAGFQWAVHDTQHLLNWAIQAEAGYGDLAREVGWLARVLEARDFPMDHFWAHVELCAEAMADHPAVAERLSAVAAGRFVG